MPQLTERFHLAACAIWCIVIGSFLLYGSPVTSWWFGLFVGISGVSGLLKVATGIGLGVPSAKF